MGAWEANIRKVVPYVAGEQPNKPNMVKLNEFEDMLKRVIKVYNSVH